jgi:hypothetical protein
VAEVNALAPFSISVLPVKQGKRVASVLVGWGRKDSDALREAFAEAQRPRFGRRARINGTVEQVVLPPAVSVARLVREDRKRTTPKNS